MKKAVFVLVLMIFILSSAAAETILFCISDNRQQDPTSWSLNVLRAFEDGVMDVLFEEGHIVTNSFLNECKTLSEEENLSNSEVAGLMANRMGADSVLVIELIFPEAVSGVLPVPESAEYSLFTNAGKMLTVESQIIFEIAEERGEEELLNSFSALGHDIAVEIAPELQ